MINIVYPKKNWRSAVIFISSIVVIALVDLLLSKILLVEFYTDKDFGFQNRLIIIIVLSFISSVIYIHSISKFEKLNMSIFLYIFSWILNTFLITCLAGVLIWIIQLIWNISGAS